MLYFVQKNKNNTFETGMDTSIQSIRNSTPMVTTIHLDAFIILYVFWFSI